MMHVVITVLLSLIMMAGLFLMLLSGVGFIQDKRFFSSAPKEVREVVPDSKPERFRGQHIIGWIMALFSIVLMIGAVLTGAIVGVNERMTFAQLFIRFIVMFFSLKAFDIGFFDWVLLCNAGYNFFPGYYPETKKVLGHYLFGYNWKTHLAHVIASFPAAALIAWICTFFT